MNKYLLLEEDNDYIHEPAVEITADNIDDVVKNYDTDARIVSDEDEDAIFARSGQTKKEKMVQEAAVRLLRSEGHNKYADRLQELVLKIVPLYDRNGNPNSLRTAAICVDTGEVFVNEGLVNNRSTFKQLSFIFRHELLHLLLQHQIRLLLKIKQNNPELTFGADQSLPEIYNDIANSEAQLGNIIGDFEINNFFYKTAGDKFTAHHLIINGEVISGLVTEDHRAWENYSLEIMYDKISKEVDDIDQKIRYQLDLDQKPSDYNPADPKYAIGSQDSLAQQILGGSSQLFAYHYINNKAVITSGLSLEDFVNKTKEMETISPLYKNIILTIYEDYKDTNVDFNTIKPLLEKIAKSGVHEPVSITTPAGRTLTANSSKSKFVLEDCLKAAAGYIATKDEAADAGYEAHVVQHVKRSDHSPEYTDAYNKVIKAFGKLKVPDSVISAAMDALNGVVIDEQSVIDALEAAGYEFGDDIKNDDIDEDDLF